MDIPELKDYRRYQLLIYKLVLEDVSGALELCQRLHWEYLRCCKFRRSCDCKMHSGKYFLLTHYENHCEKCEANAE